MSPYPALDAAVLRTDQGTPFLQEPGVVLVAMPATDLRGLDGFLRGFDPALEFGAYLEDPVALPPAERLVKMAGQVCFDDRTEVLTDEGWSRFVDLRPGSRVLTMHPSTLTAEYQRPSAIHAHAYRGELLCVDSGDISFAVTPDHRQFGYMASGSIADRGFMLTGEIRGRRFAVFTAPSGWAGGVPDEVRLPDASPRAPSAAGGQATATLACRVYRTRGEVGALARLLAHYVAEGRAPGEEVQGAVAFSGHRAEAVGRLCAELGLAHTASADPRSGAPRVEVDAAAAPCFEAWCGRAALTQLPRWVLDLPQDMLAAVWEALAPGRRGDLADVLVTPSATLAGQAQEILCKLGWASALAAGEPRGRGLPLYEVRKKRPTPVVLNGAEGERIRGRPYAGTVYCVTTDNGVVCVRRDGIVHFSGNCYASFGPKRTPNGQAEKYLLNIKSSGHGSVLEHAAFSLLLYGVSRSLTHELVRHRAGTAISQLSQRYVSGRVLRFVERPEYRDDPELHELFTRRIDAAAAAYHRMTELLLERQKAGTEILSGEARTDLRKKVQQCSRSLLPNETEAPLVMTANVRAWRHIIEMRANPHAEVEIRALAFRIYTVLRQVAPLLFGDYEERHLPDGTWAVESPYVKV